MDATAQVLMLRRCEDRLFTARLPANLQQTDLLVVSECMPLLDAPRALKAFQGLVRPGRAATIYFYRHHILSDPVCNCMVTRICRFLLPETPPVSPSINAELKVSPEGFDFEFHTINHRAEGEIAHDVVDWEFWAHMWHADDVKAYGVPALPGPSRRKLCGD
ncbi:hypothetical protein N7447_004283 [Penicillium robsamsonii]|uniref:uncharacterized protein n=1 Tax=Penicillium robsamsonii TaxID=1792511 RepID=UPI002547CFAA|nr:uncharacterized protein N7447_004283 [Penicillium robsamsonii]KAJ5827520.1 hypothetical protein N7447_004283 [Penicillium robsamsonii]